MSLETVPTTARTARFAALPWKPVADKSSASSALIRARSASATQ